MVAVAAKITRTIAPAKGQQLKIDQELNRSVRNNGRIGQGQPTSLNGSSDWSRGPCLREKEHRTRQDV
jgi:hypothetical protein